MQNCKEELKVDTMSMSGDPRPADVTFLQSGNKQTSGGHARLFRFVVVVFTFEPVGFWFRLRLILPGLSVSSLSLSFLAFLILSQCLLKCHSYVNRMFSCIFTPRNLSLCVLVDFGTDIMLITVITFITCNGVCTTSSTIGTVQRYRMYVCM